MNGRAIYLAIQKLKKDLPGFRPSIGVEVDSYDNKPEWYGAIGVPSSGLHTKLLYVGRRYGMDTRPESLEETVLRLRELAADWEAQHDSRQA